MQPKLHEAFLVSTWSWVKSHKCPRLKSLKSALVRSEDCKTETLKHLLVWSWKNVGLAVGVLMKCAGLCQKQSLKQDMHAADIDSDFFLFFFFCYTCKGCCNSQDMTWYEVIESFQVFSRKKWFDLRDMTERMEASQRYELYMFVSAQVAVKDDIMISSRHEEGKRKWHQNWHVKLN